MCTMTAETDHNGPGAEQEIPGPPYDFDLIVRTFSRRIYGMLYQMAGNAQDTEELVQETFLRAYKSLPRFEGRSALSTWLTRIAMNTANDALRKKSRRPVVAQDLDYEGREAMGQVARTGRSSEDEVLEKESLGHMREAIMQLPPAYRAPFVLNVVEGYSHNEIGKILGISGGTARIRLFRAIKMLREIVKTPDGKG
jgi:RNA polymerase sigma-70 factor (ECF subfamily)